MRIALGQIEVVYGDKRGNTARAAAFTEQAGRKGCDAVVLPECPLAGWLSKSARRLAEPVPGPFTRRLSGLARRYRMLIVSGIEERDQGRVYNSAVLIGRDGKILLKHRKINELKIGLRLYTRGDFLGVARTDTLKIGMDICADSWGPEITDTLYLMGARLILSPSAWAIQPGKEAENIGWIAGTYAKRTAGRKLVIASANCVGRVTEGPWRGRILQGNSLIVGPDGRMALKGPTSVPALLVRDLIL